MTLPIELQGPQALQEFCEKYGLGNEALGELQAIVEKTLVHISWHLIRIPLQDPKGKPKCKGKTKKSEPCKKNALTGSDFCKLHMGQTEGPTRKKKPTIQKSNNTDKYLSVPKVDEEPHEYPPTLEDCECPQSSDEDSDDLSGETEDW